MLRGAGSPWTVVGRGQNWCHQGQKWRNSQNRRWGSKEGILTAAEAARVQGDVSFSALPSHYGQSRRLPQAQHPFPPFQPTALGRTGKRCVGRTAPPWLAFCLRVCLGTREASCSPSLSSPRVSLGREKLPLSSQKGLSQCLNALIGFHSSPVSPERKTQ